VKVIFESPDDAMGRCFHVCIFALFMVKMRCK
jgi:hypothetical protein